MRRLQITIDEPLDEALEREAARRGTSKAAVVRAVVARDVGDETMQPAAADRWEA